MSRKSSAVKLPRLPQDALDGVLHHEPKSDDKTALAVRRLRSRLQSLRQHPLYGPKLDVSTSVLRKWLRVSGNDVFIADSKIRRCLELKAKMKLDSLLHSLKLPQIFRNGYPGGLCGVDRDRAPVYYEMCGLLDLKDILQSTGKDNFFRFKFFQHELIERYLQELSEERGEVVESMLVVVDLQFCQKDNFSPSNLTILSEMLHLLVDNYPTLIKEIICINVPEVPELATAQAYFKRDTWNMISLVGRRYLRRLKKKILISQLPRYLGGKKHIDGSRPYVGLDIEWSVKIPHLILKPDASPDNAAYTVPPGVRKVEEYHVAAAGSTLAWDFDLICGAINLEICANSLGHQNRLMHATCRLTMESDQRSGSLNCKVAGRYLFIVDNKGNLETPAKVRYKVTVTPPDSYMTHLAPLLPLVKPIKQRTVHSMCRRQKELSADLSTLPNVDWLNSI